MRLTVDDLNGVRQLLTGLRQINAVVLQFHGVDGQTRFEPSHSLVKPDRVTLSIAAENTTLKPCEFFDELESLAQFSRLMVEFEDERKISLLEPSRLEYSLPLWKSLEFISRLTTDQFTRRDNKQIFSVEIYSNSFGEPESVLSYIQDRLLPNVAKVRSEVLGWRYGITEPLRIDARKSVHQKEKVAVSA